MSKAAMPQHRLSETSRLRELYRYYQPDVTHPLHGQGHAAVIPTSSSDVAMTVFAQLGALRFGAKRGVISLIGTDVEYVLAEAGKTLSLRSDSRYEEGDALWHGAGALKDKAGVGHIVLQRLTGTPKKEAEPYLIVKDLANDPHFNQLSIVKEWTHARFLACYPLKTPDGYVIGLYTIIDDKAREEVSDGDLSFLQDMAATVMDHIVAGRIKARHHRADRMIKALGIYLEGGTSIRDWWVTQGEVEHDPQIKERLRRGDSLAIQADDEFGVQDPADLGISSLNLRASCSAGSSKRTVTVIDPTTKTGDGRPRIPSQLSSPPRSPQRSAPDSERTLQRDPHSESLPPPLDSIGNDNDNDNDSIGSSTVHGTQIPIDAQFGFASPGVGSGKALQASLVNSDVLQSFSRAANLIREAMGVDGAMFLDASIGSFGRNAEKENFNQKAPGQHMTNAKPETTTTTSTSDTDSTDNNNTPNNAEGADETQASAPILGFSTRTRSSLKDHQSTTTQRSFPESLLRRLAKRYPHGKIFSYDENGMISNSDADTESDVNGFNRDSVARRRRKRRRMTQAEEAAAVLAVVPGSRSVAWFPLWDSALERWYAGALVWSMSATRPLDPQEDITYLATFGNSIMTEIARMNAAVKSQMKENFLSSISHELRSPLHGILASVELLEETELDNLQKDMVETVRSCGTTLLETIDHVLEFSKIKKVIKSTEHRKRERTRSRLRGRYRDSDDGPVSNIKSLTEEVVDSVLASRSFRVGSDDTAGSVERLDKVALAILNIGWHRSWMFRIDQAALRRILMNVFSNALKYTETGFVSVDVSVTSMLGDVEKPGLILNIRDSGKGMSHEFLNTHAYTPFRQEDPLSVGTGLGLSIVKQLVQDLKGQVSIESEAGCGTHVRIKIPLVEAPSSLNTELQDILDIKSRVQQKEACIISHGFDALSDISEIPDGVLQPGAEALFLLRSSMEGTLRNWFDLEVIHSPSVRGVQSSVFLALETEQKDEQIRLLDEEARPDEPRPIMIIIQKPHSSASDFTTRNGIRVYNLRLPATPRKFMNILTDAYGKRTKPSNGSESSPTTPDETANTLAGAAAIPKARSPDRTLNSSEGSYFDRSLAQSPTSLTRKDLPQTAPRPRRSGSARSTVSTLRTDDSTDVEMPILPLDATKVLLVDDNNINLKLLERSMKSMSHPYLTATNGLEAVDAYKCCVPTYPACIFMDLQMPYMSGIEATREIRSWEREQKLKRSIIIALTANTSDSTKHEAFGAGIDLFLTKPIALKKLKSLMGELQLKGRDALKQFKAIVK